MRQINLAGLSLIKASEGLKLYTYDDATGKQVYQAEGYTGTLTAGYGHAGHDVVAGMTVTPELANQWLVQDLLVAEIAVTDLVHPTISLTDNQYAALVDFTYNEGSGRLQHSTLLARINAGDMIGAAAEFPKWVRAGGGIDPGLVTRRHNEQALFLTPVAMPIPTPIASTSQAMPQADVPTFGERLRAWLARVL